MTVTVNWTDSNGNDRETDFENETLANIFVKGLQAEERGHTFDHISYPEEERGPTFDNGP